MVSRYIKLGDLEIYKMAIELSDMAWNVYLKLDWRGKKLIGDQFIEATDSIGANIAEGYGRFHYKDKTKFFYNSRGSLLEAKHWTLLLKKRNLAQGECVEEILSKLNDLHQKLNIYINTYHKKH